MRRWTACLLSTLILIAALCAEAERPRPEREVDPAWRSLYFGGPSPSFIPERVLAARSLEELGLTDSEISRIEWLKESQPPHCHRLASRAPRGQYASFTIEEAIASEPIAFVGEVQRIVPGISNWQLFVGSAVYLKVEEVLHGDYSPPNGMAAITVPGGTVLLDGMRVCTQPEEGFHQPLVGDRLIVAGVASDVDPLIFQGVLVLPIMGGEIHPVESPLLGVDAKPIPVRDLLADSREEQEK